MSYTQKRFRSRNAIEVEEFHTARYGAPGQKRLKKKKPTPDQVAAQNRKNREKICRRKMRTWMNVNDYFTTLTYRRDARPPDMESAKRDFAKFCDYVRKEYKKRGYVLRWIRNIEVGTKNGWHIHVVLNRIPDTDLILKEAWPHGTAVNKLLSEQGDFKELAAYITKTPETDPRLKESNYWTSRNMPISEPTKKIIKQWDTFSEDRIRIPKGFYLDKDSYREYINTVTGYPHREYTLLRIDRKEADPNANRIKEGRHVRRHNSKKSGKRNRQSNVRAKNRTKDKAREPNRAREPSGDS